MNDLNIDQFYAGSYLKAADLNGRRATVTIAAVEATVIKEGDAPKLQLSFEGTDKKFTLNKTNAAMLAELLRTKNAREWVGSTISLRPDKAQDPSGRTVDTIRVDLELPAQKNANSAGARAVAANPQVGFNAAQLAEPTTDLSAGAAAAANATPAFSGQAPAAADDEIPF